jgi:SAM-dependent methyltransferase
MTWEKLAHWWLAELAGDPSYHEEIQPLLLKLLQPKPGKLYLDLGCGEGRLLKALKEVGANAIGCDRNDQLLRKARSRGRVVRALLPDLAWVRSGAFDGALVGLVLEHIENEEQFFSETARVVKSAGSLAIVINHPIWTAPKSSPIEEGSGETLWRPGIYFGRGYSDEPAGRNKVRFYHRTLSALLNAASESGWDLQQMAESGISAEQVGRYPEYAGQEQIPRILGVRWTRR